MGMDTAIVIQCQACHLLLLKQPMQDLPISLHTQYVHVRSSCCQHHRIGFGDAVSTPTLVNRTKAEVAGTLLTARLALQYGLACNTAGGTHHAFFDYGSGFCIINDLAYTAHVLLKEGLIDRVLILDLDVHQVGLVVVASCTYNCELCGALAVTLVTASACLWYCQSCMAQQDTCHQDI